MAVRLTFMFTLILPAPSSTLFPYTTLFRSATVSGVSPVDSSTYDVTISGGNLASLNGTVTLGFAGGRNIIDTAGNALDRKSTRLNSNNQITSYDVSSLKKTTLDLATADDNG